jgi:iron-sulfur cluster repair protein YtfE (RIC family)
MTANDGSKSSSLEIELDHRAMAIVHNGFRSALAAAPALIYGAEGDTARRTRVARFYASTLGILEGHHREEEEVLFPLLLERVPPDEREKIAVGIEEHHAMLGLLATAQTSVLEWGVRGDTEAGHLVSALGALNQAFSTHMDHEEATIVPLLEQHIPKETWATLDAQLKAGLPLMAEVLLSIACGLSLLWEAVGEESFKQMVVRARQLPAPA